MRNLARYANPDMLAMLGIGAGNVTRSRGSSPADVANKLSEHFRLEPVVTPLSPSTRLVRGSRSSGLLANFSKGREPASTLPWRLPRGACAKEWTSACAWW